MLGRNAAVLLDGVDGKIADNGEMTSQDFQYSEQPECQGAKKAV